MSDPDSQPILHFDSALSAAWPCDRWRDVGVVVGVSGGADSVALLCGLVRIAEAHPSSAGFLVAAHYNHGLRGEASDGDQKFVTELADRLGIRFVTERAGQLKTDEDSLRNARRDFLVRTAKLEGCRYIALAHSADDNVETVLHNLMRGTGPAGLAGISPHRDIGEDWVLVRPLIGIDRATIRSSLRATGQTWREDESNSNTDYQRNWIRAELIPLMQTRYPSVTAAIGRAAEGQRDWRELIERAAESWLYHHLVAGSAVAIRVDPITDRSVVIAGLQALWDRSGWPRREMTKSHWQRVAATIGGDADERYSMPGKIDVCSRDGCVRFTVCSD